VCLAGPEPANGGGRKEKELDKGHAVDVRRKQAARLPGPAGVNKAGLTF